MDEWLYWGSIRSVLDEYIGVGVLYVYWEIRLVDDSVLGSINCVLGEGLCTGGALGVYWVNMYDFLLWEH